MATLTFQGYMGATPAWANMGANKLIFSGSLTNLATTILAANWQDGTHAGSGDPGTDQCGANHMKNTKPVVLTAAASTVSLNGAAAVALTDANVAAADCALRIYFTHTVAVAIQNARFYCRTDASGTTPGTGVDMVAWERGITAAQTWVTVNDDTVAGILTTGGIGGDNAGERLGLSAKATPATDSYWYLAAGLSPETAGAKSDWTVGVTLEYY